MRVIWVLTVLSMALLIVPMIATVAGAIYIEGQTIPDDGQMHILAADEGQGTGNVASQYQVPIDNDNTSLISALRPSENMLPQLSLTSPTISFTDLPRSLNISSPSFTSYFGASAGQAIGHIEPPMIPGYWDHIDPGSLKTNMPVINI